MSAAQGQTAPTRTRTTSVDLPAELTTPLPEDASLVTVAARTAAETAFGVPGVYRLGGLITRAADTVRAAVGRSAASLGVRVDEEDGRLDVSVGVVVEYPFGVVAVADEVRRQVRGALGQLSAGETRVDVRVLDVHGPFDPIDEPAESESESEPTSDARPADADSRSDARAARSEADTTADAAGTADPAADADAPASADVVDAPVATAVPDADVIATAAGGGTTAGSDVPAASAPAAAASAAVAAADAAVAAADAAVAAADAVTAGDSSESEAEAEDAGIEVSTGADDAAAPDSGAGTAPVPTGADDAVAPDGDDTTATPADADAAAAVANGVEPTEPRP